MYSIRSSKTIHFFRKLNYHRYSTSKNIRNVELDKIRNIGILAHIDAGKTTTTERMLYYAGLIQQMGEVHHGNTVTDYMDQERERGITITSAAITFYWRNNQFNLIDTPGHIDFTMEVEQTLRVMDGAVVVLDGSAGVEAQTLTVWRQAERYDVQKIIYVNKMDRRDADIKMACNSIEKHLQVPPLLLQLPVRENGKLVGIIDVLTLEMLNYDKEKSINTTQLTEEKHPEYWEKSASLRSDLIDKLTSHDDELANIVINSESLDNIATVDIVKALKNVTEKHVGVPVLLGSSYKNVGVQSLMDAVVLYLPSPRKKNQLFSNFDDNLCARAFKVIHDKQKGPLVFMRVYNGKLKKGQRVYSVQQEKSEQIGRLYIAYADDFKEVEDVDNGNIAVAAGLKKINSGDLITTSQTASQKAQANIVKKYKIDALEADKLLGIGVTIPDPVFFCSIEPPSLSAQAALEQALQELQREDPSLRVSQNSETGQTVLAGMGELHLEIIRDRILKEYKIEADLGPFQIAYKEAPIEKATDSLTVETTIGNLKQFVSIKMSLVPCRYNVMKEEDVFKIDKSPEYVSELTKIFPRYLNAIRQGVEVGLAHGPKVGCAVVNAQVILHQFQTRKGTSDSVITATATQLVQKLLKDISGTDILEPVMHLEIVVPEEHLSTVLADLSRRRTVIKNVGIRGQAKEVIAKAPLSEFLGYSSILRSISSGTATFSLEFDEYEKMSPEKESIAILSVRGFL